MELDPTDAAILRLLQGDARLSFRKLARRVGVSVPTVSAHVAKLEDMGILAGYHATVDPERLGQLKVILILTCRPGTADAVEGWLAAKPEVRWTSRTQGSRIAAEAVLSRPSNLDRFLRELNSLDGVIGSEHYLVTKQYEDKPRVQISERQRAILRCFECGRDIEREPVLWKAGGRTHYLCCTSCEKLYKARYARIKAGAKA